MKISELNTDEGFEALCEITPFISHIVTDEQLFEVLTRKLRNNKPEEENEEENNKSSLFILIERFNELLPLVLKGHKDDVLGIVAVLNKTSVEELKEQNFLTTIKQIYEICKDKDFVDFFKSCVNTETEKKEKEGA